MANVIIAYDDASNNSMHTFMKDCADIARQYCADKGHGWELLYPPNLNNDSVISKLDNHQIYMFATHGYADGVCNEKGEDIVSTKTKNHGFSSKCFYAISCHCAQKLKSELLQIGLKIFVGYNDVFNVGQCDVKFLKCAMEGLKCLLHGESVETSKRKMLEQYDKMIQSAPIYLDKIFLLHNKEHLVFEGGENLTILDLV